MSELSGFFLFPSKVAAGFTNQLAKDMSLDGERKVNTHFIGSRLQAITAETAAGEFNTAEDPGGAVFLKGDIWKKNDLSVILSPQEVLQLYKTGGENFISDCTGNFALTIYDKRTETVLLFSDSLASIPVFVMRRPEGLIFTTEYESLFALDITLAANRKAAADLIFFGSTLGNETLLKDVEMLPPATCMTVSDNISLYGYSPKHPEAAEISLEEAAPQIAQNLRSLVRSYIRRYGKNLVFTLSGGLDSGLIFSAVPDEEKQNITCLTIYTPDLDPGSDKDVIIARMIAEKFRFRHITERTDVFLNAFSHRYLEASRKPQKKGAILVKGTYGGEFYRMDYARFTDQNINKALSPRRSFAARFFPRSGAGAVFSAEFLKSARNFKTLPALQDKHEKDDLPFFVRLFSSVFLSNIYHGSRGGWLYPYRHQANSLNPFLHPANLEILFNIHDKITTEPLALYHHILRDHLPALNGIPVNSDYGRSPGALRPYFEGGTERKQMRNNADEAVQMQAAKFLEEHGSWFSKEFTETVRTSGNNAYISRLADLENWASFYRIAF